MNKYTKIIRTFTAQSYNLAAKAAPKQAPKAKPFGNLGPADSRHEMMRKILFEKPQKSLGELTPQDLERHDTIETAYKLFKSEQSEMKRIERDAKFRAMENAYKELENTDLTLLEDACRKSPNARFPIQLRVPTETPPKIIWNYDALSKQ
ncbi:hypothetical protein BB559_004246 [Furculomyces boomerangus]|uniref:Large ribosomal subunit protein mL40 n=2 Tax=Harpellales TaxID=61421 RepID=A0A2T9Y141_9FUNG|nr:hypothetical protein BB559_006707 [Furculomyces boomerangus]PVU91206.1 hypothetical protein BB559_004246 [Furculomyces boomerangus]PWA03286.1 hypothetical protein BB558_000545 [Smittium angustum]